MSPAAETGEVVRRTIISRPYFYLPVSIVFLVLVVSRIPLDALDDVAAGARPELLLGAIALNVAVIALWTVRSSLLLRQVGHPIALRDVALLTLFANTVNNVTPASTGEISRAVLLERRYGVPLPSATAVILLERVAALYLLGISTGVAWLLVQPSGSTLAIAAGLVGLPLLLAAPTVAYRVGLRPLAAVGHWLGRRRQSGLGQRIGRGLVDADARIADLITSPRTAASFIVTTLAIFAVYAAQFSLVAAALGENVGLIAAWAVQGAALIAGILSAVPFGLGPAEGAITILLPLLRVSAASAALIAIGFRLVSGLPITMLGVVSYVLLSRRQGLSRPADAGESPGVTT